MRSSFLALLFLPALTAAATAAEWNSPRAGNPLLPGYYADPCCRKFGDTYYLYATPDGWDVGKGPFCIWTSKDFVHWTAHESKWPATDFKWAPSVIERGGKYYMLNSVPCQVWAAVAETPLGPWKNLMEEGKPLLPDQTPKGTITLDGEVFADDDGRIYLYYGTWGTFTAVEMNPDMRSFRSPPIQFFGEEGKRNGTAPDWFEAPYMFKRAGIYYMMYSCAFCQDSSYNVKYVTSRSPLGPWTFDPARNPILETTDDGTVDGPGHHTILEDRGRVYIVYHRHDNPHHADGAHRQVCADELRFAPDGAIEKVIPSHSGIGYLAPSTVRDTDLALGKSAAASSSAGDDFRPAYAADHNDGTLWKADGYVYPQWLQVDLGRNERVRRVETEFQFAQVAYRYRIECSADGAAWATFADRSGNEAWGPMADPGDASARYFRITVLGDDAPHRPGPEIGIWNFKLFDGIDRPNRAPEVDAGPDRTCTMRFPSLVLEGTVHDDGLPEGPVRGARWSKAEGPGGVTFEHPDRTRTRANFGAAGTYVLELEASDGELTASGTVVCRILEAGDELVLYGFDALDSRIVRDGSPNGQDGALRGRASRSLGIRGGAVALDGRDAHVAVPALGKHEALTIAAWMNLHSLEGDSALLSGGGGSVSVAITGKGEIRLSAPGLGTPTSAFRFGDRDFGAWRHVAIVRDPVAKVVSFYMDGTLDVARPGGDAADLELSSPLRIGGASAGTRAFDGELDEVAVFARALGAAEIAAQSKRGAETSIADALSLPDGAPVRFLSKVISFAPRDPLTGVRTTDWFYIAEREGSPGIRVTARPDAAGGIVEDRCVSLEGTMATLPTGERSVVPSAPPSHGAPRAAPVLPLGTATGAVLVKATGKVLRPMGGDRRGFILSTAGREVPVEIERGPIVKKFAIGDSVEVIGVVSGGSGSGPEDAVILLRELIRIDPPPSPLLVHYRFEEDGGEIARDTSGNGLDGKLVGEPERVPGPAGGAAVRFDGVKGYLQLPDLGVQTAVTVAAWIEMDGLGATDWSTSILHSDGWGLGDLHFMVQVKAGIVQASINGANPGALESKFTFQGKLGRWVHVAVAYDARARRFALYVDGREEAAATCGDALPIKLSSAKVGSWGGKDRMFHGAMADLRIYDRALSLEEVGKLAKRRS